MKLRALIRDLKESLEKTSPTALLEVQVLAAQVLQKDKLYLLTHPDREVTEDEEARIRLYVDKRKDGIPLQYLTRRQEFMGLDFEVNPHVLIPRPDTETLVEAVIKDFEDCEKPEIIDIGTGSGAIAVSLAYYLPRARIYAVDISEEALETARKNAKSHGVDGRIDFLQGSLFEPLPQPLKKFDAVVSNPPYIPTGDIEGLQTEVSVHEPRAALDGGPDGLCFYRLIAEKAPLYLKPSGGLYFEVGHDQALQVENLMKQVKSRGESWYNDILRIKDLAGIERVVKAFLRPETIGANQ